MSVSIIEKLKQKELNIESALQTLIDIKSGTINLELLDADVSSRFFRSLKDRSNIPPIIPLILWQNCYYLGCPVKITKEIYQILCQRLGTNIKIIAISEKSYSDWYRLQNLNSDRINGDNHINPLTGEVEQENITEIAELFLSRTDDQIERIKTIISSALRNRASDIHLEPTGEGLRVRYRIDGILRHVTTLPPDVSRKVIVSLKVMCEMDIGDSRRPQDGRIGEKYATQQQQEQALDLRVSTLPCVSDKKGEPAEKAVLRLLRQQNTFQTIDDLGFTTHTRPIYESWLHQPQGMIILTGPTGSGKTSTLYTSLQAIATDSVNIVTVEDPVEYVLPGITQTQVCDPAGMTFAAGLRAILRQDPDVIMLGEIRDAETAETAVRAALTGHLVLTTLHTNDAVGAIPRLKDIGPDPGLVSDALLGVVAQRLVRRVCPHCAEPYTPTEADLKVLGLDWDEAQPQQWRRGKGCPKCFNSGYLGREAVIELLNVDETVRQIIYEGTMTQLHHHLNENRFESFRVAAINKVIAGLTTIEEVRRVLPQSALYKKPVSGQRMGQVAFLNAS
jgi:type II secretory ATPase GspE/PulE/Tfp pilus assembly ATPase PilB-like protein